MAILIVDDETQTREALRNLLVQLSHKVILEAKNGEDALRMIDSEKSRIRMIIADLEMPYMDGLTLAQRVGELPFLNYAPFLLITSDLSLFQLASHQKQNTRIDHSLVKPFRMSSLAKAMNEAHIHRCSRRNQILFIGKEQPASLVEFLSSPLAGIWKGIQTVQERREIQELLENFPLQIGAVLLDPTSFDENERSQLSDDLSGFKKTPFGISTPLTCLSRKPREVFHFRTFCQFFEPMGTLFQEWQAILDKIQVRNLSEWEMSLLFQETKYCLQQREFATAWKKTEKMLKLDFDNCDVHCIAGDILEYLEMSKEAILAYQRALELNPGMPRPYLKLLKLIEPTDRENFLKALENGVQFCPHNLDILLTAAKAHREIGNSAKAKKILETALKLNPQNSDAKALLESLQC